jgi:hypothetical protein
MRSAIGTALLSNIIMIFLVVMLVFLVGSLSYSKAYRIKNNVINLIEREKTFNKENTDTMLSKIGYRIVKDSSAVCEDLRGAPNGPYPSGYLISGSTEGNYRYCVYEYNLGLSSNNKTMLIYAVTTYMYLDIPLIGSMLEFPIYGETKTIYR